MNAAYNYNRYGDNLAHKKRRRFFIIFSIVLLSLLGLGAGLFYLVFFSPVLKINEITIEGSEVLDKNDILQTIYPLTHDGGTFILPTRRNILFFDEDSAEEQIRAEFPIIKQIILKRILPHKILVRIEERKTIGTWCFLDSCYYFDDEGVLWGQALKSSGPLLLIVDDLRGNKDNIKKLNPDLLRGIRKSIEGVEKLAIKVKKIEIPENSLTDFRIYTITGYYILIDYSVDIDKQLSVLDIFLKDKGKNFNSEYIDLRIEGRVYYK